MGDKEKTSEALRFDFLGLYRPGVILGNSNTPAALAFVMPLFDWAMPSRYHSIYKNDLARAMVAQSEQAYIALAQGKGPAAPAVKILEYKEMETFFVAGDPVSVALEPLARWPEPKVPADLAEALASDPKARR